MLAPQIEFSDREERIEFIQERFHCKAPSCGGCGSCNLPDGVPAAEYFADYIDGKVEFVKLAAKIWSRGLSPTFQCNTKIRYSIDNLRLL